MLNTEEYDNLLKELTSEDLTTDRQLEIFASLQLDRNSRITQYDELVSKSDKLQTDFKELQKKKVDDFFNKGTEFNPENDTTKEEVPEKELTYADVIIPDNVK